MLDHHNSIDLKESPLTLVVYCFIRGWTFQVTCTGTETKVCPSKYAFLWEQLIYSWSFTLKFKNWKEFYHHPPLLLKILGVSDIYSHKEMGRWKERERRGRGCFFRSLELWWISQPDSCVNSSVSRDYIGGTKTWNILNSGVVESVNVSSISIKCCWWGSNLYIFVWIFTILYKYLM